MEAVVAGDGVGNGGADHGRDEEGVAPGGLGDGGVEVEGEAVNDGLGEGDAEAAAGEEVRVPSRSVDR
jgi:hypothetical protein